MDDDDLDLGEAAAFILGERPRLQEDDVWTVLKELGDPPVRNADGMAVDLVTRLHPGISGRAVRIILDEWREYARLAVEDDWD